MQDSRYLGWEQITPEEQESKPSCLSNLCMQGSAQKDEKGSDETINTQQHIMKLHLNLETYYLIKPDKIYLSFGTLASLSNAASPIMRKDSETVRSEHIWHNIKFTPFYLLFFGFFRNLPIKQFLLLTCCHIVKVTVISKPSTLRQLCLFDCFSIIKTNAAFVCLCPWWTWKYIYMKINIFFVLCAPIF